MTAEALTSKILIDCLKGLGRGQSPTYVEGESSIYAINQKCVRNGSVNVSYARPHYSLSFMKKFAFLQPGDACINSTGTGTIGRVGLWSESATGNFFVDSHVTIARPNSEFINPSYFAAVLQSPTVQSEMETYCFSGSTNQIELNKSALSELKLNLLPRNEQDTVAKVIVSIDQATEQTEAIIAKQQRIKTGLMQDLLTKGIDENGNIRSEATHEFKDSPLGRIPVEWEVVKTGDVCTSLVPGRDKPELEGGGIPWITIPDIEDKMFVSASKNALSLSRQSIKKANAKLMPVNTVLMSCVGEFGIAAIATVELVANQQLHGFVCGMDILPEWLMMQIRNSQQRIDLMTTQTTIKYLNKTGCESIKVALPEIIEQRRLVATIKEFMDSIVLQKIQLEKLQSLKSGLMHDLLTGNVRVTNIQNPTLTSESL